MNVRTLCLGILSLGEASGYELKKAIEDGIFSHFIDASFGSIYPALAQMNAEGLLTLRSEEQSGKPDKKVYAITEAGRASLAKGLSVVPAKDKFKSEFLFEMLLQHLLTKEQLGLAVSKHHSDLKEELARIEQCSTNMAALPGAHFVSGYGEAVLKAGIQYLEDIYPELKTPAIKAAE